MSQVLNVLSSIFWGVLVLSILVAAHEAGHFLAAHSLHVRVTEFFLGMPCRFKLSRRSKSHGTEYGITPLLLGGYTRICGMGETPDAHLAEVFALVQKSGRISLGDLQAQTGIAQDTIYQLCLVLIDWAAIEPAPTETANKSDAAATDFAYVQTVARDQALLTRYDAGHADDFIYPAGDPQPISTPDVALAAEAKHTYQGTGVWGRLWMLVAGPLASVFAGLICFVLALSVLGTSQVQDINQVGTVDAGSLAQQAGISAGDTIASVAGTKTTTFTELAQAIHTALAQGEPFELVYTHEGSTHTASVDPAGHTALGITAPVHTVRLGLGQALSAGAIYCTQVATFAFKLIVPTHTAEVVSQSSSIMGISVMASEAASLGVSSLILFAGAISISLGFMNLLPIPPLDGGKMLIEIIQGIRRKPLSLRVQTVISYVGIALFVLLFVVVLRNDILRFVIG